MILSLFLLITINIGKSMASALKSLVHSQAVSVYRLCILTWFGWVMRSMQSGCTLSAGVKIQITEADLVLWMHKSADFGYSAESPTKLKKRLLYRWQRVFVARHALFTQDHSARLTNWCDHNAVMLMISSHCSFGFKVNSTWLFVWDRVIVLIRLCSLFTVNIFVSFVNMFLCVCWVFESYSRFHASALVIEPNV